VEGRIGKYELQNELGRGGFGRVFRAYDPSVGRPVAIKVLTAENDPELMERFRAEAGTTGQLQHKNIVTVFDCGEQDGAPYIVMELLEGDNLQTILQAKRNLGVLEKMRIMCQVAEGLHYAHQRGVIHRDVKPANLLLLPNGVVKIMDFGIARLSNVGMPRRTRTGDLIGTTSYMSPEQFRGADADVATDIFAYGVIYYELLSGVHPFQARDVSATIFRILSIDPLPLQEVFPECPAALETLVHRAMAKDPQQRYRSLDDLLIDAEPIMLDLRRDQSAQAMIDVKNLIEKGDFDNARTKLRQALELDPANQDARRVRETLEQERNRRWIEESIQKLERDAAAKAAKRQFTDALQSREAALRLKPDDERLKALVESSRAAMLASREASRLLSEAKREAQNERYAEAKALALQALAADPQHPEAPPLIRHVEDEIARIENARHFRAEIEESERLLAEGGYETALAKLQQLEAAFPAAAEIRDLQSRVLLRQTEDYRRKRVARLDSGDPPPGLCRRVGHRESADVHQGRDECPKARRGLNGLTRRR
jgi:serine/threonine-protein kinase